MERILEMSDFFDALERLGSGEEKIETRESIVKAPFGYPGGKSRSIKEILPFLPYTERYVEVFGGSGIILINRNQVKLEIFNDRYSGVVDFYRCIQSKEMMEELIKTLDMYVYSRELFLEFRDTWQKISDPVERAAKWYYMHQNSFTNQGRNFARTTLTNMNMSNKIRSHFPLIRDVHKRFKNVLIENLDWATCINDFDTHETVFYLDPPYMPETIKNDKTYEHTMNKQDHINLCNRVFSMKGFVALSGYKNEIYDTYPWDNVHVWDVNISFDGKAYQESNSMKGLEFQSKSGTAREYLYIKYA
jgi:DNA adenine methylase